MYIQAKLVNGEVIEQFVDSDICVIGRSSKCDVVIPHEGMSRQHCQIEIINGEYFITDLGSTNGVLIDNERIEPHQRVPYQTYLALSFGAVQSFQVIEEPSSESVQGVTGVRGAGIEAETPSSLTRTKILRPASKREIPQSSESRTYGRNDKNEKFRLWVSAIGAALLILGAISWYLFQDEESDSEHYEILDRETSEVKEKPYDQF